jgi:hypothetical protein
MNDKTPSFPPEPFGQQDAGCWFDQSGSTFSTRVEGVNFHLPPTNHYEDFGIQFGARETSG